MQAKELLKEMRQYAITSKVPIIEQESINWLETFLCDKQIDNILEIGGAISFSTIWFQQLTNGTVLSIEKDSQRYEKAEYYLNKYENRANITFLNDDAKSEFFYEEAKKNVPYDLIFIDATKRNNQYFFEKFAPMLKTNGYIITDNIDFHGLTSESEEDIMKLHRRIRPMIRAIIEYRKWLTELPDFETTFIDVGDKLAITKKIK